MDNYLVTRLTIISQTPKSNKLNSILGKLKVSEKVQCFAFSFDASGNSLSDVVPRFDLM